MVEASTGESLEADVLREEGEKIIDEYRTILGQNPDFAEAVCQEYFEEPNLNNCGIRFETNGVVYVFRSKHSPSGSRTIGLVRYDTEGELPTEELEIDIGAFSSPTIYYGLRRSGEKEAYSSNNQAAIDGARKLLNSLKPPDHPGLLIELGLPN